MTRIAVAKTALFVAAVRARETERKDRLFDDQLASILAGPEGIAWLAASEADPTSNYRRDSFPYLEVRTRYFDDWAQEAVRSCKAHQLVILGAGMDTRAFRLPWPEGLNVWEVDTPELLELKEERLRSAGARAACERVAVDADLTSGSWPRALVRKGFDKSQPSVWVAEGLFLYLKAVDVKKILRSASSASPQGSRLGAEILSKEFLQSSSQGWALQRRKDRGAPWVFGTDDPEGFFRSGGWEVDRKIGALEAAKTLGRLAKAYAGAPPATRARSFFVSATRRSGSRLALAD